MVDKEWELEARRRQGDPPPQVSQHSSACHQVPSHVVCSPSKRKMQHISNLSIAVMYVMYFLAALFGYLTFYGMAGSVRVGSGARWGGKGWPMATVIIGTR